MSRKTNSLTWEGVKRGAANIFLGLCLFFISLIIYQFAISIVKYIINAPIIIGMISGSFVGWMGYYLFGKKTK